MIAPRPARVALLLTGCLGACLVCAVWVAPLRGEEPPAIDPARNPAGALAADLGPLWECLSGARETFAVEGTVAIGGSGKPMKVAIKLEPKATKKLLQLEFESKVYNLYRYDART